MYKTPRIICDGKSMNFSLIGDLITAKKWLSYSYMNTIIPILFFKSVLGEYSLMY